MKTFRLVSVALLCGILVAGCQTSAPVSSNLMPKAAVDSLCTALGYTLGNMVKQSDFGALDNELIMKAFKEIMVQEEESTQDQAMEWNQTIQNYVNRRMAIVGEANQKEGEAFLEENRTKEGVIELPSGLQYKVLVAGNEKRAAAEDTVQVHYTGTLIDGTKFDSSYDHGEMAKFPLNRVIPAWTEGMQLVGEGGKIMIYAPSALAYGPNGAGTAVGPNCVLIFEVELNAILPAVAAEN